jgi:hypothetical protein
MPLFGRPDGTLATDVPPVRRIMPYLMRTRSESTVFLEQELDLTKTLPFIEAFNAAHPDTRISVFHLFLWATVKALDARPRLNRFASGGRIYQRNGIWISYSAKKAMNDDSPIITLKRRFDPTLSLEETVRYIYGDVKEGRSDKLSHVDKELKGFLMVPGPILSLLVRLQRWLDAVNLLPRVMIEPDPLYASLFIANIGSLKLESPFHHLYEYGTISVFAAIGKKKELVTPHGTRTVCSVKYTLDERVEDGLYCATALDLVRKVVEDPAAAS